MAKQFQFYGVCGTCYKLDDTVWEAKEDESDGYRSYLDSVQLREETGNLTFQSRSLGTVNVVPSHGIDGWDIVDVEDGHVWLTIGTDHSDNYYPSFVFQYNPRDSRFYNTDGSLKSAWERFIVE
jgi:hypothetical protein